MSKDLNPFTFVDSVSSTKEYIFDESIQSEYVPFLTNRAFSYHADSLLYAAEMNLYPDLDKRLQYDYYFHSLRKAKRIAKWPKKVAGGDLELIQRHYGFSVSKAIEALRILTDAQVDEIKKSYDTGGERAK